MDKPWYQTPLGQSLLAESAKRRPVKHVGSQRMYGAARQSRLTADWAVSNSSADYELNSSLRILRARSRQLVRDAGYARRARTLIVNNVIGTGIGMEPKVATTRAGLHYGANAGIESAWETWCRADNCHTGGALHFSDLERAAMAQVFETGEAFIQVHRRPFGAAGVPIALELVEAERIADELETPAALGSDVSVRMGIELDAFYRPVAYYVRNRHPGEIRWTADMGRDQVMRIPASDMFHVRIVNRWPQTRGEPWLHAVARKLNDMDGYSEAEIIAARGAAYYLGVTESDDVTGAGDELQDDGTYQNELEPGINLRLRPGEKFQMVSPNRPNVAMDPFMRYMLREVAAGVDVSYESLSRDYSQSNYSSSRLALLDDRDCWRALQLWWIRAFREPLHRQWLQAAVLSGVAGVSPQAYAMTPEKFEAARFKPRGWSWVDPTKEVTAYKEAVKAGFKTVGQVIAETAGGQDIEDVMTERKDELELMDELDLEFDTSPAAYLKEAAPPEPAPPADDEDDPPDDKPDDSKQDPPMRVFSFARKP